MSPFCQVSVGDQVPVSQVSVGAKPRGITNGLSSGATGSSGGQRVGWREGKEEWGGVG